MWQRSQWAVPGTSASLVALGHLRERESRTGPVVALRETPVEVEQGAHHAIGGDDTTAQPADPVAGDELHAQADAGTLIRQRLQQCLHADRPHKPVKLTQ